MPTALDVDVGPDDAITPPAGATKKKITESLEGNKITPSITAEKPKQPQKAQPSITFFFKQPSSKNLFSNMKASPPTTTEAPTLSSKEKNVAAAAKPAAKEKSASEPKTKKTTKSTNDFSFVPTEEEIREIVLGSSTNLDDVVVPQPVDMPSEDDDSLLPIVPMRNPGRRKRKTSPSTESATLTATTEQLEKAAEKEAAAMEMKSPNAPVEEKKEPATEPTEEPSNDEEHAQEDSSVMQVDDEAIRDSHGNHDEDQSDDDTVDMEAIATKDDESGRADESMDCGDLTTGDIPAASAAPKQPKPGTTKAKPLAKKQSQPVKPSPSKPAAAIGLSAERKAALGKNEMLRVQYQSRLDELIKRAREGLEEENFQLPAPSKVDSVLEEETNVSSSLEFPECAIRSLALLIQERWVIQQVCSSMANILMLS